MTAPSLADHASRLERVLSRHTRLQDLVLAFSRDGSRPGELKVPFATLCEGLPALFGAEHAEAWFHDRERRELVFEAGSGRLPPDAESRLSIEETDRAIVRALRSDGPEIAPERSGATLLIPLRGRQRALGVLIVGGLPRPKEAESLETIGLAEELSRQVSVAIENRLLFEHVIGQAHQEAARLAHSQKLAALGQFVAGIAHELNNPLQSVLGHLELLRRNRKLPRALAGDVWLIYREADRAARIVGRLLVFAGARGAGRRQVSPNAALARALSLRSRACRDAAIAVVRRLDPAVPRIVGDALLLQQAFLNIIVNAEHAITARRAAAHGASPAGHRIEASSRARRGAVIVEIRDTGHGINSDVLPRIFEPFFTTKEVGQGIGLGLALTHGIIQEHGGSIAARPHPGGGTVFRIELPVPRSEARGTARRTKSDGRPEARGPKHGPRHKGRGPRPGDKHG